jgi:hypothetical protein
MFKNEDNLPFTALVYGLKSISKALSYRSHEQATRPEDLVDPDYLDQAQDEDSFEDCTGRYH